MDKQTLSHYGWIVVSILVLTVMIAFATPFGKFVGTAVNNIKEDLTDVKDVAMERVDQWQFEYDDTTLMMSTMGDTNGDGAFTLTDVTNSVRVLAGLDEVIDLTPYDLNEDGIFNYDDAQIAARQIAEIQEYDIIGKIARRNPDIKVDFYDNNKGDLSKIGDINQDTRITKNDVIYLRDLLKNLRNDLDLTACDIDGNGVVNVTDLDIMTSHITGETTNGNIGKTILTKTGITVEYVS